MPQETPEEFWQRVETEIGETHIYHTMARCRLGCLDKGSTNWGLFFITPSAVYLWIFPRESWIARLVAPQTAGTQSEEHFRIPLDQVESARRLHLGFFQRLFGAGSKNQIELSVENGGQTYVFEGLEKDFPERVVPIINAS